MKPSVPPAKRSKNLYGAYLLAILLVLLLALGSSQWPQLLGNGLPTPQGLAIVAVAALMGGLGPGLAATTLLVGLMMVQVSQQPTTYAIGDLVHMLFFICLGVGASSLIEALQSRSQLLGSVQRRLDVLTNELEETRTVFEKTALTDSLTELGNRRAFDTDLELELERAKRGDYHLAVLFFDLDGLKTINDKEGHERGDALLVKCAQVVRQTLRKGDRLYRIGGDEFAAILLYIDPTGFEKIEFRVGVAVQELRTHGFAQVGISAGLASFPSEARDTSELVRLSDERMYIQKRSHKNRKSRPTLTL